MKTRPVKEHLHSSSDLQRLSDAEVCQYAVMSPMGVVTGANFQTDFCHSVMRMRMMMMILAENDAGDISLVFSAVLALRSLLRFWRISCHVGII